MSDQKVYYVCHGMYGCETGCCGYRLCLDDEGGEEVDGYSWTFDHPDDKDTPESFARSNFDHEIEPDALVKEGKWYKCD